MVVRKPTDKCLLCRVNDATKLNSHIIPASLLTSMIGKRDKEHSFVIDTAKATEDEYYGRDRLDNPSTEIKEHHFARDYYFCDECEKKLGAIESKMSPPLIAQIRDPKFSGNYKPESAGGLTIKTLPKVSSDDFNVFFLSIIWRQALQRKLDDGVCVLSGNELKMLRIIVCSYLSDKKTYQNYSNLFGLMIFTADSFDNATINITSALNHRKRPYIFLINEFWVFVYATSDIIISRKFPQPNYFHIPPFIPYLNYPGKTPSIVFLTQHSWTDKLKAWNKDIASIFTFNLNQKNGKGNTTIKQSLLYSKRKSKATKKVIRVARKANRGMKKSRGKN